MARTWKSRPAPSVEPTTITELARRYHSCAVALSRSLGLPMSETFVLQFHNAISSIFIAADRAGVRLPPAVQLPPLEAAQNCAPDPEPASDAVGIAEGPAQNCAPAPEPDRDPLPPGEGDAPVVTTHGTGEASVPTRIPAEGDWPCAGQEITHLKPAQLHLLLARAGFRAHADAAVMPLLAALQAERARRMARGQRPKLVAVEANGDVP